jgi:hypothetical protein
MRVTVKAVIKGAGFFKGAVEGVQHDTGQVFIEEPFDASKPNYKGFRTVEYKCLDSNVVAPLMDLPFPLNADVDMEMAATKRGQQIVVHAVKVLGPAMAMPTQKETRVAA